MKQTKLSFGEQCYNYSKELGDVLIIDVQSLREIKDRIEKEVRQDDRSN